MKVSLNWARKFTDIDLPVEELVKLATERLGGIEGFENLGAHYEGIVVAKIVSCVKHPNADKLNLCKIDDGGAVRNVERDADGLVQVICGAPNAREGIVVAWIPPASVVPASYGEKELFVLEARDLRGEISNGMLASPRELGLNDDHDGILEIDQDAKPGTLFKELYDLDDIIIEIENKMFTHRPDCFGQLGAARELAGIQHKAFQSPDWYIKGNSLQGKSSDVMKGLGVTVEDSELCPRYMAVLIDNIQIKPSPIWLQSYLKRVGVRPINNVVDITNCIMLETAQPLHAFDFDKVAKDGRADITVRKPHAGEKMTLLDGKQIEPHQDAVLICSPDGPIALGGVMGGNNSEVDANTKRVVLECATFDMYNIRKTSMIHGIFTDAVTRFNKGQPPEQLAPILYKAVQLFEELAGANMVGDVVDSNSAANGRKRPYIELTSKFINERLGSKFTDAEIIKMLTNVEFEAHQAAGPIEVTPPFWRTDIEIPEDIVEEVGRLYGFNQLPLALPKRDITPVLPDPLLNLKQTIRERLSRAGANELLTYSFVHGDLFKKVGQDFKHAFALRNALSPDLQYYRLSILPNLLDKVHSNVKAGYDSFALFELGKVHYQGEMDEAEPKVPNEDNQLAFVVAYDDKTMPVGAPYFLAKKYLSEVAPTLIKDLVPMASIDLSQDDWGEQLTSPYEPSRSALIVKDGQIWGVIGEFSPTVRRNLKLPDYTAGFEVHLDVLSKLGVAYMPLSKYPSIEQDVTLKVSADVPFRSLQDCLTDQLVQSEYEWNLKPTKIYQKDQTDTKNITFHLTLTHQERTLTTKEVNELINSVTWQAHEQLQAVVV